jgi:hypothetical protein
VAARVDRDHFELPSDALERPAQMCPADQQWRIEEVTQALAVAVDTKDFRLLPEVLEAWTATMRLQRQSATRRRSRPTTNRSGSVRAPTSTSSSTCSATKGR